MQQVMSRWLKAIPVFVCLMLTLLAAPLWAAENTGSVKGTIADASGKVIVGASVTIENASGLQTIRALTDGQGYYIFTGLTAGHYALHVSATGFGTEERILTVQQNEQSVNVKLLLASVAEEVVVEADDNSSLAVQQAIVKAPLDSASARTEISSQFIREFTSPMTDTSDITQAAPGTMSYSVNGIGNGQAKTWFRGFKDGMYTMTWDGVPFQDSNDPTHHSWAYVPAPAISYVDFDRSPGTASDVGPANFGGSIHMFSPRLSNSMKIKGAVSYGSFNSTQYLGEFNSGLFGNPESPLNFWFEGHHQNSDGYQTNNFQQRTAATAKLIWRASEKTNVALVGTSVIVDSNTPNNDATRRQLFHNGDNYLMESNQFLADGVTPNPQWFHFYNYHVPTNFEVGTIDTEFGHGWKLNSKTYTYSYSNHQHYQNAQDSDTNVTSLGADIANEAGVIGGALSPIEEALSPTSGINKLNQYNRIGQIATASSSSRFGVLRFGAWYEWTTTHRYQVGSNPANWVDSTATKDLKFHERFYTDTYQPFVEYQLVALKKWTITAGIKNALYQMKLKQFADGKTVGSLGGLPYVIHDVTYNNWLPSIEANYRIRSNWSAYGQYGRGSVIPPSSVFDATGAQVAVLPKPTLADTVQGGTIFRVNRFSMDADVFHVHFDNNYTSYTDLTGFQEYFAAAPSNTIGFEGEGNLVVARGLSFSMNGTVGQAKYEAGAASSNTVLPGSSKWCPATATSCTLNNAATPEYWVSNAAHDTESLGLVYQNKGYDFGFFNKRIGTRYDAAAALSVASNVGAVYSDVATGSGQNITYDPFWTNNLFFNYTIRKNSFFDQSKIKVSVNNLFDYHDLISVSSAALPAAPLTPYTKSAADQLQLLPGRSIMFTFQIGLSPREK
jgi:iron complex outermembrane receptor protein